MSKDQNEAEPGGEDEAPAASESGRVRGSDDPPGESGGPVAESGGESRDSADDSGGEAIPRASGGEGPRYDVIVIGGGPGGYAAALYGAGLGLDVALVEEHKLGGTCLNVGCIPAKELLETAAVYRTVSRASEFGVDAGDPGFDWSVVMARKQRVVDRLMGGLSSLLGRRGVTVHNGTGTLCGPGAVRVAAEGGSETIRASAVILATGSKPRTIPGFEVDGKLVVTSDELLSLPQLPRSAAVIGGGAIGCEFASMLGDLGVEVTLLEALPGLLSGCDADVVEVLGRSFRKRGIAVRTGVSVSGHEPRADGDGTTVRFRAGDGDDECVDVDLVVVAVGRKPFTEGLGLGEAGVAVDDRGFVAVDGRCRTSAEAVWAVGDVIDTPQLAHTAFAEGMLAVSDVRGEDPAPIDYPGTPWCIYSHPEVAFAGHTERSAVEAGYEVVSSAHRHAGNGRALIVGETDGVVKVVAQKREDGSAGRILGVHMCGPWVTEQLGQGYLAVNWEATVDEVAGLIQPHPTLSELFGEAALSLAGRSLHG